MRCNHLYLPVWLHRYEVWLGDLFFCQKGKGYCTKCACNVEWNVTKMWCNKKSVLSNFGHCYQHCHHWTTLQMQWTPTKYVLYFIIKQPLTTNILSKIPTSFHIVWTPGFLDCFYTILSPELDERWFLRLILPADCSAPPRYFYIVVPNWRRRFLEGKTLMLTWKNLQE